MIIGVPKEVKDHEARVGIVPSGVKALVEAGHRVLVETKAGELSSMPDRDYKQAGAEIAGSAAEVWNRAEMVVRFYHRIERPGADDLVRLRAQRHREDPGEQLRLGQPAAHDLRRH